MKKHCFVICAYKESPYLEKCIQSLIHQEVQTSIYMCTSTPNEYISGLAEKYAIPLMINPNKGDIQSDWNFAYNMGDAQYITLVHQDDIYNSSYSKYLYNAIDKYDDILIFYSKYRALITTEDYEIAKKDINCMLRNLLCVPMCNSSLQKSIWWKKLTLRFGNSICCSSVTYNKEMLGNKNVFRSTLRYSLDWDSYWEMASLKGRFYYDKHILSYFRIHQLSTSMLCIENDLREKEDYVMFCKIWPKWFADMIIKVYRLAYCNYKKLK